jgi:hypothetical protein
MDVRIVVIEKEIKEKSFVKTYKVEISGLSKGVVGNSLISTRSSISRLVSA